MLLMLEQIELLERSDSHRKRGFGLPKDETEFSAGSSRRIQCYKACMEEDLRHIFQMLDTNHIHWNQGLCCI